MKTLATPCRCTEPAKSPVQPAETGGKRCSYFDDAFPLAMSYVPYQKLEELDFGVSALKAGTIFKALRLPLKQKGWCR